nr:immunoglobulin light chain junction region [Macaca mulatta]MPO00513.1 immunoglobulin light chain junction region [Macaca mulatta]
CQQHSNWPQITF